MAVKTPPTPPSTPNPDIDAGVIEDARARQQRHRRIGGALIAAAVAGGVLIAGIAGGGGGSHARGVISGRPSIAGGASPADRVAERDLGSHDHYNAITTVSGRILLYNSPSPSVTQSTFGMCSSVVVNPSTLALSRARTASCADPAIFGRSVVPVISLDKDLPASGGGPSEVVRIAHLTPGPPGYALGPAVMSFPALAYGDTRPSWIYGGGDLWLYDRVNHFDLLRVSATTGAVLQRLVVAKIQTPLLAFNQDGLWIAPIGESSGPLYRLTPGATQIKPVFKLGRDGFAWWLVASGDSVWIDQQPRPVSKPATIWELRGPMAMPVWHRAQAPAINTVIQQLPVDSPSIVVGNGSAGLWTTVISPSGLKQQVIRVVPRTGKLTMMATLTPRYPPGTPIGSSGLMSASWQATTFDGSLFLLNPSDPTQAPTGASLYRVTPRDH